MATFKVIGRGQDGKGKQQHGKEYGCYFNFHRCSLLQVFFLIITVFFYFKINNIFCDYCQEIC